MDNDQSLIPMLPNLVQKGLIYHHLPTYLNQSSRVPAYFYLLEPLQCSFRKAKIQVPIQGCARGGWGGGRGGGRRQTSSQITGCIRAEPASENRAPGDDELACWECVFYIHRRGGSEQPSRGRIFVYHSLDLCIMPRTLEDGVYIGWQIWENSRFQPFHPRTGQGVSMTSGKLNFISKPLKDYLTPSDLMIYELYGEAAMYTN